MSVVKINNYSVGDVDLTSIMTTVDKQRKGYFGISLTEWGTSTIPEIANGSIIEVAGALFEFNANEAISGSPSNGTVYVKIVPAATTCTAEFTNTAPTWDDDKQGWYGTTTAANHRYVFRMFKATAAYDNKAEMPVRTPSAKLKTVTATGTTITTAAYPGGDITAATLTFPDDVLTILSVSVRSLMAQNTYTVYAKDISFTGAIVTVSLHTVNDGSAIYYEVDVTAITK